MYICRYIIRVSNNISKWILYTYISITPVCIYTPPIYIPIIYTQLCIYVDILLTPVLWRSYVEIYFGWLATLEMSVNRHDAKL